jgi:hypothetical protein
MKINSLKLIDKNETYIIFEVSYKSFFGEKKRIACGNFRYNLFYWMDTNKTLFRTESIEAWISTGKEELTIY